MGIASSFTTREGSLSFGEKLIALNWGLVLILCCLAGVGLAALYSAGGGNMDPWASKHLVRFSIALGVMFFVALIDIRFWARVSYVAYGCIFVLLIAVELMGVIGMGAQRWINLGFVQIQPSELMKITLVMVLARYFHGSTLDEVGRIRSLIIPAIVIFAPVGLVLLQPNLGTASILVMVGVAICFMAGVKLWKFIVLGVVAIATVPVGWHFMHDYQKKRVLTFLNPESDPLGAGYNIMQSKIALGSGGLSGKGFLQGTQSHLNFLPEKQTDFIFTLLAEEWGFFGGLVVLTLCAFIFAYGILISVRARHQYGRLLALGLTFNYALYVFINIGMVMGLMPVVGVPLPLVSYGGTSMLTAMIGFGLIMSVYIHRDVKLQRYI